MRCLHNPLAFAGHWHHSVVAGLYATSGRKVDHLELPAESATRATPLLSCSSDLLAMRSTLRCRCGQQASCRPLVQPVQHGPTLCHVVKQQHRLQRTFAAASDVDTSEATISDGRDPSGQRMKERLRKRVKTWRDSSSANTGLISINKGTNTAQAAACVAADFRDTVSYTGTSRKKPPVCLLSQNPAVDVCISSSC